MNELTKYELGNFTISTIQTGLFRLDGGAMFGVVPKTLWSKKIEADEFNRIPMGMRSMVIQSKKTNRIYLVDAGIGTKYDAKFKSIYALEDETYNLLNGLASLGLTTDDITDVILTHLHFDHGGGVVTRNADGELVPTFQHATLWVTQEHWNTAHHPNAREKASFLPDNIPPLSGMNVRFYEEGGVYEEGLDSVIANGHTLGQQLPRISQNEQTLLFAADLLPTYAHIPLPWVMGYDMEPKTTLEEKVRILEAASKEKWIIVFEHDAQYQACTLKYDGKRFGIDKLGSLLELLTLTSS